MRKIVFITAIIFAFLMISGCKENSIVESEDGKVFKGPGSGGHTETLTNNLSFPALLVDGYSIVPLDSPQFSIEYTGPYTGLTQEELDYVLNNGPWFAQKTAGNKWQAEFKSVSAVNVTLIDWGDAIESVDPKIGRPYRLELALYNKLDVPMSGYSMALLAFPSSNKETQGTNCSIYLSDYASIASSKGKLIIQRFESDSVLTWNGEFWDGAYPPEQLSFMQELNVGGKLIYGASQGGWKASIEGNYRITFFVLPGSMVNFSESIVADITLPTTPKVSENNQPYVDVLNNLSYVDVQASGGGGGGKKP